MTPNRAASVLHINVRLSEGGAAGVARTLCTELQGRGFDVTFAYGYGPHGKASTLSVPYPSFQITPKLIAGVHRANHIVLGHEAPIAIGTGWRKLEKVISECDLVHLHVIHSYFLNMEKLFGLIKLYKKPVVWTLHDHWVLTGRCAQPAHCELWMNGCGNCPSLTAYPPALLDRSAVEKPKRTMAIDRLQNSVPSAIVACAEWLGRQAHTAGLKNVKVVRNSVDRSFWEALTQSDRNRRDTGGANRLLFICRDLRDRKKIDWSLLQRLSQHGNVALTIVGDHAPSPMLDARYLKATNDRSELASLMAHNDTLIFTSKVDYYPLTIAEALTAGMKVIATDSPAAREFLHLPQVKLLDDRTFDDRMLSEHRVEEDAEIASDFHPQRMTDEYVKIYSELMGRST